jgi:hypothetical protein
MTGPTEEIGKAANSTIEALKSTPVVLALVIFNVLYMAGSFWAQTKQWETYDRGAQRWKDMVESVIKHCNPPGSAQLQSDDSKVVEWPPLPRPRPAIE